MKIPEILYEDDQILVCIKPSGIPVQTRSAGTADMESLLKNHLMQAQRKQEAASGRHASSAPYLAVIHRLDQPVEGILVFAKTPAAAGSLNRQLQKDSFGKYYQAVVCGTLPHPSGELADYLVKDGRTNTSRICSGDTPGAKKAVLSYEVMKITEASDLSLVKIKLQTGRHHQIRVQMAGAGTPLWGDNKYNPAFTQRKGYFPIALCAYRLCFRHPTTNQNMEFSIDCDWKQLSL